MRTHVFEMHGRFCAGHPLEVIVTIFTLTACALNMDSGTGQPRKEDLPNALHCRHTRCDISEDSKVANIIVMTIIRCLAVLFTYYQFRNLQKMGSKYILGIAGIFTVFCSAVFTSSLVSFSHNDATDLFDALFSFLLLIDLSKAATLAQYALSSRSQEEVRANIARGMSLLGPTITLDTLVETLLIGIGSLSGVRRLEILCTFACLGVIVNYVVFMTFYPACLSLILELSRGNNSKGRLSADRIFIMQPLNEEDQKPNPVVERVKMIMIGGLFLVHAHSRWPFNKEESEYAAETIKTSAGATSSDMINNSVPAERSDLREHLTTWLSVSVDNIVILILLLALALKYVFFEEKSDIKRLRFREEEEKATEERAETNGGANGTVATGMPLQRFGADRRPPVFPLSGVGGGWFENDEDAVEKEVETVEKEVQTDVTLHGPCGPGGANEASRTRDEPPRSLEDCLEIYKSELGANALTDEEVIQLVKHKHILPYQLEKAVGDMERGVGIRRLVVSTDAGFANVMAELPYKNYDYSKVLGSCCENVIGYVPLPVGIAGPLLIDGELYYVPMATTEGCLVASTNRGSRALMKHGVTSCIVGDGMTRGPVVRFSSAMRASEALEWMQREENYQKMKDSFDKTSGYARLTKIQTRIVGRRLYIRFVATTGDAMGMNMLSKGTEKSLYTLQERFPEMEIVALSGNFCIDKKPAAVNWIEGRGKSVVCEAVVPGDVVTNVLKTSVRALVDVNTNKNLIGSAVAGSVGGFNAHAANIVTAIFIATGQDPAQNVGSSNCMTLMEPWGEDGQDLLVSCTMPSIEVGTVGGGTGLPAQSACLAMLGAKGPHIASPGENASKLARIVCATVLAGELSLMAALSAGHLVRSHLRHNRSSVLISNAVHTVHSGTSGSNLAVPTVSVTSYNLCSDAAQDS